MELRVIKTFHAIVKLGSFHKAATFLNYSQPTVTLHMKHLEEELGEKLLERGKTLKLTEAGSLFFERASALLREYEHLDQTIDDLKNGHAGVIKIGVSEPTASMEFPLILKQFATKYPGVEVVVNVGDANTLSDLLARNEIEFAICGQPEISSEHFYEPIFQDEMVLLVPEKHKLANKQTVSIEELAEETFIFTPPNCPIRILTEQYLIDKIGTRYKKIEVTSSMAHKYYVKAGLGISLFTKTASDPHFIGTRAIKIKDFHLSPIIGLLQKKKEHYVGKSTQQLLLKINEYYQLKHFSSQLVHQ